MVEFATYNVNNIRKRLGNLLEWLDAEKPDVACLQELKTEQNLFPLEAVVAAGYHAVWKGQRTWKLWPREPE